MSIVRGYYIQENGPPPINGESHNYYGGVVNKAKSMMWALSFALHISEFPDPRGSVKDNSRAAVVLFATSPADFYGYDFEKARRMVCRHVRQGPASSIHLMREMVNEFEILVCNEKNFAQRPAYTRNGHFSGKEYFWDEKGQPIEVWFEKGNLEKIVTKQNNALIYDFVLGASTIVRIERPYKEDSKTGKRSDKGKAKVEILSGDEARERLKVRQRFLSKNI